jgi:UDP-N-acetylglucosamine acyltransferase
MTIHPTAVVDASARLGQGVTVGPHCVIGPGVEVGEGCRLLSHVVLHEHTVLGPGCVVSPFASLGGAPQDLKYKGEPTRLVVGARNVIREGVTFSRGTPGGGGITEIGDDNLFMAQVHVAHDCKVGSRIVFANAATLAGHVEVGDRATVGAYSGIHQFCRVAREAFIGGYSVVVQDALPWVTTVGNRAASHGINLIGMKRAGYSKDTIEAVKRCYMTLFRSKLLLDDALTKVEREWGAVPEVAYFLEFVRTSPRGVTR